MMLCSYMSGLIPVRYLVLLTKLGNWSKPLMPSMKWMGTHHGNGKDVDFTHKK